MDLIDPMTLILLIVWTILTLLAGAAAVAVRTVSRSRLEKALKRRNRSEDLKRFDAHEHEYALILLVVRQLGIVMLIVTIFCRVPSVQRGLPEASIAMGLVVLWLLLFGAAIPSAWARYAGERFLARGFPVLESLRRILSPLLWVFRGVDEIVRRLSGAPRPGSEQHDQVEREILDALSHGGSEDEIAEREKAIIRSAIQLDEISVGEIMTPRTDIQGIEAGSDYETVRQAVIDAGHSRMPVYEETLDHIAGFLYAKDLLSARGPDDFDLVRMMRPATFIPETKDLATCLREFQQRRVHVAVVVDEYGGTAGLVTIEDILEELVGEIADEHDEPEPQPIHRIDARTAEVDARVRVEEVNEALDIALPADEAYDTVGGFVLSRLGRIPLPGESVTHQNVRVEVVEARPRAVRRLRIHAIEPSETHPSI